MTTQDFESKHVKLQFISQIFCGHIFTAPIHLRKENIFLFFCTTLFSCILFYRITTSSRFSVCVVDSVRVVLTGMPALLRKIEKYFNENVMMQNQSILRFISNFVYVTQTQKSVDVFPTTGHY